MVLIRALLAIAALAGADVRHASFARYPATVVRIARAAPPRLNDALDRRYRSALREAAARPVDFAGHWVLASIGCGAGCVRPVAIDRSSGRVAWFPATVSGWPLAVREPLTFRRDSRLLVVQGMLDEREPSATRAYLFDGRRFVPLPA